MQPVPSLVWDGRAYYYAWDTPAQNGPEAQSQPAGPSSSSNAAPASPPAGPLQNKGLVADLCKIIERQSQEIACLVQNQAELTNASTSKGGAAVLQSLGHRSSDFQFMDEGEVGCSPRCARDAPHARQRVRVY